jgi:hypothetical protein
MDQEVLLYLVIAGLMFGIGGPLIGLLVYYVNAIKRHSEQKRKESIRPH